MLIVRRCGRVPYREALALQRQLHERRDSDTLLLMEHPPVYTLGVQADPKEVLIDPATLGAEAIRVGRGGKVTYHGPGQLIGYPIITLAPTSSGLPDVVSYVRRLEDVLIAALADLGIDAGRISGLTGVWVGDQKIAAIGVRVRRNRTLHGFALNVTPDLDMFRHIVPCGLRDREITSVARCLSGAVDYDKIVNDLVRHFVEVFGYGAWQIQIPFEAK